MAIKNYAQQACGEKKAGLAYTHAEQLMPKGDTQCNLLMTLLQQTRKSAMTGIGDSMPRPLWLYASIASGSFCTTAHANAMQMPWGTRQTVF